MSNKRRRFRKNILLIEFIIFCFLCFLIRFGFGIFGWWFLLYIIGCLVTMFVVSAFYFFLADSKDWRWRNEEAQEAADKMAGMNMQLSKLYPGWSEKENGSIAVSEWWKKDRQIAAQYLIRYRSMKATEHNLETSNWFYRLGWYRQLQKTSEEMEEYEAYIEELKAEISDLKQLRIKQEEIHEECEKVEQIDTEQHKTVQLDNDLEVSVFKLLNEGVMQKDIAEVLEISTAKVSRIKKKWRKHELI